MAKRAEPFFYLRIGEGRAAGRLSRGGAGAWRQALGADGVRGRLPGDGLSLGVDLRTGGGAYEWRGGVNRDGGGERVRGGAARFRSG